MTNMPDLNLQSDEQSEISGLSHNVVHGRIDTSHGTVLYLEDVSVSFDGFKALNKLSLTLNAGELRCIIG
ncbi:MAG: ABC transporter ATP-binding protein, partial [Gammaproteobacteria bacterium]|nr:ABC transporter ATP-binding protein [Gammaproteobacteria bacterium]